MTNMTKQFALAVALVAGLASVAVAKDATVASNHNSGTSRAIRAIQVEQEMPGSFSSAKSSAAVEERWFERTSESNS